ncbi:Fic family protein [Stackebrandtia albiflava]|uniref:Fic family protein n=1 Tax=Stackebrandtia albiflava TaxID=406432 RepID=A0A562UXZ8_9ACTN|nr:Fic family protein [Stackebrandtia albiflava]TWJ10463.1 Fic family protein [Stackebrandtia albiflava]
MYLPDRLVGRPSRIPQETTVRAAKLESAIRDLADREHAHLLEGVARFLLRSEAVASSKIEGLVAAPQKIALAEMAEVHDETVRGFTETARLIASNIAVLRRAVSELATMPTVGVDDILDLHRALLLDSRHHGLRKVQNWIGGGDSNPLGAQFVPPPPEDVPELMADLVDYLNSAGDGPLVQAAILHAQFETIHPFTDGNGRIGRALIHTVLARRGLTSTAILPISLALRTRQAEYVEGLTAYRYFGDASSDVAVEGVDRWLRVFLEAGEIAVAQADELLHELTELQGRWRARLETYRTAHGLRPAPRSGSAVARLLATLPETPALTARIVERLLKVSHPAARAALEELAEAGILHRKQVERGTTGYLAKDVFEVLTFAERQLASADWDTRLSPPVRAVPGRPQQVISNQAATLRNGLD